MRSLATWSHTKSGCVLPMVGLFRTFLHGPPKYGPERALSREAKAISVAHPGVPEGAAISSAKLLVQLRAVLRGGEVCSHPVAVVRTAESFNIIAAGVADFLKEPSSKHACIASHIRS